MATRYPRSLGLGVWDGSIDNVTIRWKEATKERLSKEAAVQGIDQATMKALTEHFLYETAVRRRNTAVALRAVPHDFTIDSSHPENGRKPDPNHVSGELSGGPNGKRDVHVYLGNLGTGNGKYDNATVVGESLTRKSNKGRERGPEGVSTWGTASTPGPSVATNSTYTASASNTTPIDSGWVLDDTYNKYKRFDPTTNQWEWAP
ncbi:hypothetical protein BKA65DRAFT_599642 [Rhexocercosporidium sp. MPI-PUGE-AT-0058]|nr:hypothetical protein BKA65DRAFT_599642 [Rhexocercosporidium sp. MPI-PUGE-AT-0058]